MRPPAPFDVSDGGGRLRWRRRPAGGVFDDLDVSDLRGERRPAGGGVAARRLEQDADTKLGTVSAARRRWRFSWGDKFLYIIQAMHLSRLQERVFQLG